MLVLGQIMGQPALEPLRSVNDVYNLTEDSATRLLNSNGQLMATVIFIAVLFLFLTILGVLSFIDGTTLTAKANPRLFVPASVESVKVFRGFIVAFTFLSSGITSEKWLPHLLGVKSVNLWNESIKFSLALFILSVLWVLFWIWVGRRVARLKLTPSA